MPEYRRRLPHFQPEDAYLFLTWRLWGSLPKMVELVLHRTEGQAFVAQDRALDRRCSGPLWLRQPRIAALVPVSVLMRWLKGSTARSAHLLLGRTGRPFWLDESYDHYARHSIQRDRIIAYIEQNPVSAGLVASADLWPWSSAGWQAQPPAPPDLAKL